MISFAQAQQILEDFAKPAATKKVKLQDALGAISAHDIFAPISLPSFRNSAMDGFAICANQVAAAYAENKISLKIAGKIAAGEQKDFADPTTAAKIMTGAEMPAIYDVVVPVEMVEFDEENVVFSTPAKLGDNVREVGQDVLAGSKILSAGDEISAQKIMLLAAQGFAEIVITNPPKICILSTGNEIVDVGGAGKTATQIYNSNSPYLLAEAKKHGFCAEYLGIFKDDASEFAKKISAIIAENSPPQIIISTGAVSKGEWDFIPETLKKLGAEIHFHRVNIRPGKPVLFATFPNGSYYFGLPGNPISTVVGFQFFVLPLIRKILGAPPAKFLHAKSLSAFNKRGNFKQFLKANLRCNERAEMVVEISTEQESFKIQSLTTSDCWMALDEDCTQISAGEIVKIQTF